MAYQALSERYLGNAGSAASNINALGNRQSAIASRPMSYYSDQAALDSNRSFDEALGTRNRNLTRMGVNPNSGRFKGLQQKWALARAAAEAGAQTRGRRQGEALAMNWMDQTANTFGRGVQANRGVASDYGDLASQQARAAMGSGPVIDINAGVNRNPDNNLSAVRPMNGRQQALDIAAPPPEMGAGGDGTGPDINDVFSGGVGQQWGALSGMPGLGNAPAMEPMMDTGALNSDIVAGFANGGPGAPMSADGRMSALGNEDTMPMGGDQPNQTGMMDTGFGSLGMQIVSDLWGDGGGGLPGLDIGNTEGYAPSGDEMPSGGDISADDLWAGRQRWLNRRDS